MVIPVIDNPSYIKDILKTVDGILIPGGIDPNPMLYGQGQLPLCGKIDNELDKFEIEIIDSARNVGCPIFGICRGIQIINIAYGGTLFQDMSYSPEYDDEMIHAQNEAGISSYFSVHEVNIEKESLLHALYGDSLKTNSLHHQSVDKLGRDLHIIGRTKDGAIEAVLSAVDPFVFAVQWHPEKMFEANQTHLKVFEAFIQACKHNRV